MVADTLGNAYVGHISWVGGVGQETGLWVHRYNYVSSSWSPPVNVSFDPAAQFPVDPNYRLNDKLHMAVDLRSSSYSNNVYATWIKDRGLNVGAASDIYFSRSVNQGANWTAAATINDGGLLGSNMANGPNAAVAPNGTIYVTWMDIDVTQAQTNGTLYLDRSADGGLTWGADIAITNVLAVPRYLQTGLGAQDARARSYPALHTAPNDPNRLYLVYAADRIKGDTDEGDIYFITSSDGGITWSSAVQVNDVSTNDQFEPWLDVKDDGTIDVVWCDRRNDLLDEKWDVYIARSTDGGTNFSINVRLTDVSFATPLVSGERWMGEYLGIATDTTNAYVAFTSSLGDTLGNVYFDRIENGLIPEPSAVLLLLCGGFALRLLHRRR